MLAPTVVGNYNTYDSEQLKELAAELVDGKVTFASPRYTYAEDPIRAATIDYVVRLFGFEMPVDKIKEKLSRINGCADTNQENY